MYTNFVKLFYQNVYVFPRKSKKSVLTSECNLASQKWLKIPPCSLDSHIKTSQLGKALILPICCITRPCLNTVISKALGYFKLYRKLKTRGLFFVSRMACHKER